MSCASGAGTVGAGCPPPKGGTPCPDSAAPRGARVLLARPADRAKTELLCIREGGLGHVARAAGATARGRAMTDGAAWEALKALACGV